METRLSFSARLRLKYWRAMDRYFGPQLQRSILPYTTHLPVLLAASFLRPIRHVLELGSGEHSTLAFLDRDCFPELQTLVSLETDARWAERVQQLAAGDPRLQLQFIQGTMARAVGGVSLDNYDLLFLDDSSTIPDRSRTIATVAGLRPERPFVVIHDFEVLEYQYAALPFRHCFRFTGVNPGVGLLWNSGRLPGGVLRTLNSQLRTLPHAAPPPNRQAWAAWLKGHLPARPGRAPQSQPTAS